MGRHLRGQRRNRSRGQTVIELWITLIVLALVGGLTAMTVLNRRDAIRKRRAAQEDTGLLEYTPSPAGLRAPW